MPPVPRTIGRYTVQRVLGRGGMGTVYLATDPRIDRQVAIKVLPAAGSDDHEHAERLLAEARVSGRLVHPHIVGVYDVGDEDGQLFVVMPYVSGRTLASVIADVVRPPLAVKLEWMAQLCDGLAYAHERRVIHRDIKPGNLLVDERGALRILDFGIAKVLTTSQIQFTSVGTPAYMAPEQYSSAPVDPRTDVFSAGLVFYELLTHRRALTGTTPAQIYGQLMAGPMPRVRDAAPEVDPAIAAVCERAMAREPNERYQTAQAFADALHASRTAPPPVTATAPTLVGGAVAPQTTARIDRPDYPPRPAADAVPAADGSPGSPAVRAPAEASGPEVVPDASAPPAPAPRPAAPPGARPSNDIDRAAPHWGRVLVAGFVLAGIIGGGLWAAFSDGPAPAPPVSAATAQLYAVHHETTPRIWQRGAPTIHAFTGTRCATPSHHPFVFGDPPAVFHYTWEGCTADGRPDPATATLLRQRDDGAVTLWRFAPPQSEFDNWVVFSPDASTAVVGDATGWSVLQTSDGRVMRRLSPAPGSLIALSDDGAVVLYGAENRLGLLEVASGDARQIDVAFEGTSPWGSLSANGRFVAFVAPSRVDGPWGLYRYDRQDGSLIVVNPDIGPRPASLIPPTAIGADGEWIVYSAWRALPEAGLTTTAEDQTYLYAYQVSTGRTRMLDAVRTGRSPGDTVLQPLGMVDGNVVVAHRNRGAEATAAEFTWMALPNGARTTKSIDKSTLQQTLRYPSKVSQRCFLWPDFSAWCVDR